MSHMRTWTRPRSKFLLSALVTLVLSSWTQAATVDYCSPDNYATGDSTSSNYMSNGLCQDTCRGSYAFAILLGKDCWCSNYAPSDQVDTSQCSDPCPGYPSDTCGNSAQGLYAYFDVGGSPSGTAGGASPTSRTTSSRSSSEPTQVYTSVISVTGRVSTIIVTPTPAQTDSALGGTSQSGGGGGGVSGGTVAGIVVGVAVVIGLLIGGGVFFWLRKRHRKNLDAISEGGSYTSPSNVSKTAGAIPSRQVSQMSSAGLLTKPSRVNTTGFSATGDDHRSAGTGTINSDRNSTHMTVDQRLNPWAIYSNEDSRASNVSLQDNQDYSRQLRVANPDP